MKDLHDFFAARDPRINEYAGVSEDDMECYTEGGPSYRGSSFSKKKEPDTYDFSTNGNGDLFCEKNRCEIYKYYRKVDNIDIKLKALKGTVPDLRKRWSLISQA